MNVVETTPAKVERTFNIMSVKHADMVSLTALAVQGKHPLGPVLQEALQQPAPAITAE